MARFSSLTRGLRGDRGEKAVIGQLPASVANVVSPSSSLVPVIFAPLPSGGDDTATLQGLHDNSPVGSAIWLQTGAYKYSSLNFTKPLLWAGTGFRCAIQQAFGNAAWIPSNLGGTILQCTSTTTPSIKFGTGASGLYGGGLRDFLVLGPGTGTSVGIQLGDPAGPNAAVFFNGIRNVMVANFATNWDLEWVEDSVFVGARARACHTGFKLDNNTNQNDYVGTEVQFSDTVGIDVYHAGLNNFRGGLLQNVSGTAGMRFVGGQADDNKADGFWCEASSPPSWMFDINGTSSQLSNMHFSANVSNLAIVRGGVKNQLGPNWRMYAASPVISISGGGTDQTDLTNIPVASGPVYGVALTDGGTNTSWSDLGSGANAVHVVGATSEPAFNLDYVAGGGGERPLGFHRNGREVVVAGAFKSTGGQAIWTTVTTLPAAYRPATNAWGSAVDVTNNTLGAAVVTPAGLLSVDAGVTPTAGHVIVVHIRFVIGA